MGLFQNAHLRHAGPARFPGVHPVIVFRIFLLCCFLAGLALPAAADVIINVLAVNGTEVPLDKDISFSLPGELKPSDIIDAAGLQMDYDVKDAGYFLHGRVSLQPKETKTFRVRVKDVWKITDEQASVIKQHIEQGFKEMGGEKSGENGEQLKEKLEKKLDYILDQQVQTSGNIEQRIDSYRNHLQSLREVETSSSLIDYWRSDPRTEESNKIINYMINVENPGDKAKKIKQQHVLPPEVRPEYIVDRQGYEIRFDEKKGTPFLFKEEQMEAKEKRTIRIGIKDVWFVPAKDTLYVRERADGIIKQLENSKFLQSAKTLYNNIINNLDLIAGLQAEQQPDIQQHIGAYRINQKRFQKAKEELDALEKLLARYRADLEKSKVKNVMQKIQSLQSMSRISQAIFDKRPTVNAAWKIIGSVMIFLGVFMVIHFVTWFVRTARQKKQEEMVLPKEIKEEA